MKERLKRSVRIIGNSNSCPLCLNGLFSLLGSRSCNALSLLFILFFHNFLSLSEITSLKLSFCAI